MASEMTRTVVAMSTPVRVIHVRLFQRHYWEVFERPGVEPFYLEKRQAVYYAEQRGRLGNVVVRIYDEAGNVEREIVPAEEDRMLYRGNQV